MFAIERRVLLKACAIVGSQSALARRIGVSRARVNNWLNRSDRIPLECVLAIESATNEKVSRYQLAPSFNDPRGINLNDLYNRLSYMEQKFEKMAAQVHLMGRKVNQIAKSKKEVMS